MERRRHQRERDRKTDGGFGLFNELIQSTPPSQGREKRITNASVRNLVRADRRSSALCVIAHTWGQELSADMRRRGDFRVDTHRTAVHGKHTPSDHPCLRMAEIGPSRRRDRRRWSKHAESRQSLGDPTDPTPNTAHLPLRGVLRSRPSFRRRRFSRRDEIRNLTIDTGQ